MQNNPMLATQFVGRTEELQHIAASLADPHCRLLTLIGPGGIGKTRLALEVTHGQQNLFSNGVYFVALQALGSHQLIVPAIAEALNFPLAGEGTPLQQLINYLSDKSCLLLLDNFEHLLAGVDVLSEIVQGAADIKLLVTSRERLNLVEEWGVEVSGLSYPTNGSESDLEGFDSVQLFLQRARQVQAGFVLTDARKSAVARICRAVGGMPLGIELAASWVRVLPCDQLANEIERSLQILETPARNMSPRHRSMRAVLTPTWERLWDAERDVYMKLSVFQGGFTRNAAEAVAGASLQILSSLADKSLLRIDSNERYDIHELLRQFGFEQLSQAGKVDATRDSHSAYYADFCAGLEPDFHGRAQLKALNEMEADFENVRTAWLWAVERGNPDLIDRMVESVYLYREVRANGHEMFELLEQAHLKFAPRAGEWAHRVWGRLLARVVFILDENIPPGRERLQQALAQAQQLDNRDDIGYCFWRLGEFCVATRSFADAIPYLEQSLMYYRETGDRFYIAKVLNEFGRVYEHDGQPETALPYQRQSLDLRREIGDLHGIGWCLWDMGHSLFRMGRYAQATQSLEESADIWRTLKNRFGRRATSQLLADLALLTGEFERGKLIANEALDLMTELGIRKYYCSYSLATLGVVAALQGDYILSQQLCQQSIEVPNGAKILANWGFSLAACGLENYPAAKLSLVPMISSTFKNNELDATLRILPVAAVILAYENQPMQAVELLGCAFTYPDNSTGWLEKWAVMTRLRADLQAELGIEIYQQAWEKGRDINLRTAMVALLTQFQAEADSQPTQTVNRALVEPLSERELEVLRLIAQGLSNQEIAEQLVVEVPTIKKHINHIYGKLGVETRTQALLRAQEWKLV